MLEESVALTVLVTAVAVKCSSYNMVTTTGFQNLVDNLTHGVLIAYVVDVLLLLLLHIPLPFLHDTTWAGAAVSLLVIMVAFLNLILAIATRPLGGDNGNARDDDLFALIFIACCIFWIIYEFMGLFLKLKL